MTTTEIVRYEPNWGVQKISLRKFVGSYHESFCGHCGWLSFMYYTEREAIDAAKHHSELCCERLNQELATTLPVEPIEARYLIAGQRVLLRDARVLEVVGLEETDDPGIVWIHYNSDGEANALQLPVTRLVKVLS